MQRLETLDIDIVVFFILIIIHLNASGNSSRAFLHNKLFMYLVWVNMVLVVLDVLGWAFNGLPGTLNRVLNIASNTLIFISIPFAPGMWIIFSDYRVNRNLPRLRRLGTILITILAINTVLCLLGIRFGWIFHVNEQNIYSRGPYFVAYVIFCTILLLYSFIFILCSRKQLGGRHFFSLVQFFFPQMAGIVLQALMYGTSYNWAGMALSLLIIYFYINNRDLNTDYLTGVYNRRELDGYIQQKIKNTTMGGKSFSAILVDMNDFKRINDRFGHETGDAALVDTVDIIKKNLRPNDFLARYGGDEFIILLDMEDHDTLLNVVQRINDNVGFFNAQRRRPYEVSFSMGADVYNTASGMSATEFISHIDKLMYQEKNTRI